MFISCAICVIGQLVSESSCLKKFIDFDSSFHYGFAMKFADPSQIDQLPGIRLTDADTFRFQCHAGLSCFNRCCRNLNLFLYPYDVIRLKHRLNISSDQFLEQYADVVLREGYYFPEVLLKMAENDQKTCPFLTDSGCSVYPDRPDTCRSFPLEHGLLYDAERNKTTAVHFFKPPEFCMGQHETREWTLKTWAEDQDAKRYNQMTDQWTQIRALCQDDPFGGQGPDCSKGKMAFMAAYNIDRFREFVFHSSFLKRYKIKSNLLSKMKKSDAELLNLGFEWIKFYLWGIKPKYFTIMK